MKQVILLLTLFFCLKGFTQTNADAINGKWLKLPKEDLIVEVFKSGTIYKGRISGTKDSINKKNIGFIILDNLQYNARNKIWGAERSTIQSQERGMTRKRG